MYDRAWYRYKAKFLKLNPLCYCCGFKAAHVDHIVAHKGDREKFEAVNNHMPLCHSCHSKVTGMFDMHNPPRTEEKIKYLSRERRFLNNQVKIKVLAKYPDG